MRQQSLFPTRILSGGVVATLVLTALSVPSWGQEGPPRFLLTGNGPVGVVQSLAFTPDSGQLLSGGSDKFVSIWGLTREGANKQLRPTLSGRLFWEISRSSRGFIYALAISPGGEYVAIGGYGARDTGGDIQIYDLRTHQWAYRLPGHKNTVCSLAFSPDGRHLISVSNDGVSKIWETTNWTAKQDLPPLGGRLMGNRPAVFLSNNTVAVATNQGDKDRWYVATYDLTSKRLETRKQIHVGAVHAIAKAPDSGVWASADRAGNLYYWSDVGSTTARLLRTGRVVATLAFASSQRLFVTTMKNETGDAYVELWDLSGRRKLDELKLATGDHLLASAVSPDGSCFATPSDDGSISLFPLKDDQGNFLSRPFTDGSPVPIAGSTRKLYRVAFDSNSTYRLGMSTIPTEDSWETLDAKLTHGFDLKEVQIYDPAANLGKWRSGSDNASNWRVTRSNSDYSVELRNGAVRKLIHLDPSLQGLAECYAWISDATGAPYAIAIGTSQHGIFVYSVSVANECRLLRHFRDHYGQVTSLCVSADGRYLASASVDGSAKIWSLNGLNAPGREFSQEAGWGAVFRKKGANTLTVGGVDSAGIIARRGINPGDEILKVVYEGNGGFAEANTADGMFRALENTKLWQTVILSVQKPGDRRSQAILLKPAWEPVASLVLDNRNEWVMWTPQGFYNASAGGDELIGWILNDKHDHPVARFFQADRFRRELEKPEVMKNLLTARSLPAAFQTAKQQLPTDLQDGVSPVVKRLPRVEIESPLPNEQLASGRTIEAKANFVFTNEEDIDNYELALYVNGIPAQKPKKKDIHGNVVTLTWNVVPPNERNLVRVVASQKSGNSVGDYSDARVSVRAKTTPYKPNLYYVGIAANDYPGRLKLEYCRDDVSDVLGLLQGGATRHFRLAQDNISLMFDQKVTKESIDQLPDQLQSQFQSIDPRDVLIVYVAGHGATKVANRENPEYYFITIDAIENTGNANGARAAAGLDHSIPWSTIRQIADLPCRKIFMIDTCFEADTPRLKASDMAKTADSLKYAVRPLRQRETMVITGCSLGQSSYQSKAFAHGLFTQAVLESLQGFADGHGDSQNKDRTIELRELTNYVLTRVPSLAEAAETKGRQTPTVSNTELGYLPLVDY